MATLQLIRLRGIVFDLDGVIADTEDLHRRAYNLAFADLGIEVEWSEQDYRDRLILSGGKKLETIQLPESDLSPEEFRRQIYSLKRSHYQALLRKGPLEPRPGVIRLIREARERGVRIGAASTCAKEGAVTILEEALGMEGARAFSVLKTGEDTPHRKPAPDIYLLALEALDLPARDCVAIEDSQHGLEAAKAAGLWTLVTPSQYTAGSDFSLADRVVPDLERGGIDLSVLDRELSGLG
jgi:HAD superfamily hydrolase (TIGR01509 family)